MKKSFSAFLCGLMICCSQNVQAGLSEEGSSFFALGFHVLGIVSIYTAIDSRSKASIYNELNKDPYFRLKFKRNSSFKGDSFEFRCISEAIMFGLLGLFFHGLGIFQIYRAGQKSMDLQKVEYFTTKKRKTSNKKLTMKHAIQNT